MIEIEISGLRRKLSEADESWINQQIKNRLNENQDICIRVYIKHDKLNFILSTKDCFQKGRPKQKLTDQENSIVNLWNNCNLDENNFSGYNLIAFLKQVQRYL